MRKLSAPGLPNSIQSYEGDSSLVPIISAGVIRVGSLKTRERKARSMRNEGEENQHNLQAFTAAQNKNYQLQSLRRTTVSSAQSHRRDAVPWYDASAETPRHQTLTNHYLTDRRPPQDKAQSRTAIIAAEFWTIKQQHHGCVMWCGMWTFDSASRTRFRRQAWKVTSFVTDDQDTNLIVPGEYFAFAKQTSGRKISRPFCTTKLQYHPSKYHFWFTNKCLIMRECENTAIILYYSLFYDFSMSFKYRKPAL